MKNLISLMMLLMLAACGDSVLSPSPVGETSIAEVVVECPQSGIFPTETQVAVFLAAQSTGPGVWNPEVEDAWKKAEPYTVTYTFTPAEPSCEPSSFTLEIPAIICLNDTVFNPNAGQHGSCEGE